jgi:hypothetical protein
MRPHIKGSHGDPGWFTKTLINVGKGIVGGSAVGAVSFVSTAVDAVDGLVVIGAGEIASLFRRPNFR